MVDPTSGPFLFGTSAESWLARTEHPQVLDWLRGYLAHHQINVSAATVLERVRGYSLLWRRTSTDRQAHIETARIAYLENLGRGGNSRRGRRDHSLASRSAHTASALPPTGGIPSGAFGPLEV